MGKINTGGKCVTAHETTVGSCRTFVERRVPFHTSNKQLFGYWTPSGVYAVFSYGQHWPLFVFVSEVNRWFANEDKYGTTTSKHYGKAHPFHITPTKLSCTAMKTLVAVGYEQLVVWRLAGNEIAA